jgi:hypothetical protein
MAVFVCMVLAIDAEERFLAQRGYRADSEVAVLKVMHDLTDRAHDGRNAATNHARSREARDAMIPAHQ